MKSLEVLKFQQSEAKNAIDSKCPCGNFRKTLFHLKSSYCLWYRFYLLGNIDQSLTHDHSLDRHFRTIERWASVADRRPILVSRLWPRFDRVSECWAMTSSRFRLDAPPDTRRERERHIFRFTLNKNQLIIS